MKQYGKKQKEHPRVPNEFKLATNYYISDLSLGEFKKLIFVEQTANVQEILKLWNVLDSYWYPASPIFFYMDRLLCEIRKREELIREKHPSAHYKSCLKL